MSKNASNLEIAKTNCKILLLPCIIQIICIKIKKNSYIFINNLKYEITFQYFLATVLAILEVFPNKERPQFLTGRERFSQTYAQRRRQNSTVEFSSFEHHWPLIHWRCSWSFFVTMQQLFKKVQKQKLFDLNINILFTTFELPKYKSWNLTSILVFYYPFKICDWMRKN